MAFGEGEESPTDHNRQGGLGRGMRIATGAERPRNDMFFTRGAVRRADVGIGPYENATRGAMGGRPQGSPLRKRYKGCGEVWNPPVTASPCQPPLGKGAEGTGVTDCHNQ